MLQFSKSSGHTTLCLKSRKECAMLFSRFFYFPSLLGIPLYGVLFNGQLAKTSSLHGNQDVKILPNNHVMFYGEWGMFTCKSKIPGNLSWNYSNQEYIHSFKIQEKLFSSFLNITIVAEGQGLIELNISCLVTTEEPVEAVHTSQARLYVQFKDPFSKYPNPYITPLVQTFVTRDVTFLCTVPYQVDRTPGIITWTHTNDITASVNSGEWWSQIQVTKGFLVSNGREEERNIWCHYQSYNQSSIVMSVARLFVQSTVYPAISPLKQTCVKDRGVVLTCSVWSTRQVSGHFEWYSPCDGIRNANISYGFLKSTLNVTEFRCQGEQDVSCSVYWNGTDKRSSTAYARLIVLPASRISETTCFCEGNDSYSGSPTPVNGSLTLSCGLDKIGDKNAKCVETQKNSCLWSSFDETQCVGFNYLTTVKKDVNEFTRNLKSRISCYLSIAVLIISALAYATVWKNISSTQSYIYVNLCIALVLTNCLMAISTQAPFNNLVSCVSVIVFMNLFRMAAMILLAAEALLSVKEEDAFDKKLSVTGLCSGIAACCIAGLIIGITVGAVGNKTYVSFRLSDINCHMSSNYSEPVLDAYVAPITIFALVAVKADFFNLWEKENKNRAISFRNIILTLVMYITWIMGLLIHNGSVEDIIFTISNFIQSILIVTLGTIKNELFREAIEERRIRFCVNPYAIM